MTKKRDKSWARRHALKIAVVVFGIAAFITFTVNEYGYFRDQCHNQNTIIKAAGGKPETCPGFWSPEHKHDWFYNGASNWHSEILLGIGFLVVFLKIEGPRGADKNDT